MANKLIGNFQSTQPTPKITKEQKVAKIDSNRSLSVSSTLRLSNVGDHLPSKGTYRRCAYCSTKKNVKRSNIICSECDVALCLSCYKPFHET